MSAFSRYIGIDYFGVRVGEAPAAIGRKIGLTNEDFAVIESVRDKTPAKPLSFG